MDGFVFHKAEMIKYFSLTQIDLTTVKNENNNIYYLNKFLGNFNTIPTVKITSDLLEGQNTIKMNHMTMQELKITFTHVLHLKEIWRAEKICLQTEMIHSRISMEQPLNVLFPEMKELKIKIKKPNFFLLSEIARAKINVLHLEDVKTSDEVVPLSLFKNKNKIILQNCSNELIQFVITTVGATNEELTFEWPNGVPFAIYWKLDIYFILSRCSEAYCFTNIENGLLPGIVQYSHAFKGGKEVDLT